MAGIVVAGACLALAAPAGATFPGHNGLIAYPSPELPASVGGIWVMRPGGSHRRALVRQEGFLADPAWSPGGRRLVYVRWKTDDAGYTSGRPSLYMVAAGGRHRHRIAANASSPSWSPDGHRLAFLRDESAGTALVLFDAHSGRRENVTNFANKPLAVEWSPDGTLIAYADRGDADGIGGIWTMRPDGSGRDRIAALSGIAASLSWAPDSSALVFGHIRYVDCGFGCSPTYSIARVGRDGGLVRTLVLPEYENSRVDTPVWSPDGTAIAYCRSGTGPHGFRYDRYASRPDGRGQHYVSPTGCGGDWQARPRLRKALPRR